MPMNAYVMPMNRNILWSLSDVLTFITTSHTRRKQCRRWTNTWTHTYKLHRTNRTSWTLHSTNTCRIQKTSLALVDGFNHAWLEMSWWLLTGNPVSLLVKHLNAFLVDQWRLSNDGNGGWKIRLSLEWCCREPEVGMMVDPYGNQYTPAEFCHFAEQCRLVIVPYETQNGGVFCECDEWCSHFGYI